MLIYVFSAFSLSSKNIERYLFLECIYQIVSPYIKVHVLFNESRVEFMHLHVFVLDTTECSSLSVHIPLKSYSLVFGNVI